MEVSIVSHHDKEVDQGHNVRHGNRIHQEKESTPKIERGPVSQGKAHKHWPGRYLSLSRTFT